MCEQQLDGARVKIITTPTFRAVLHRDRKRIRETNGKGQRDGEREDWARRPKRGDNGRQGGADPI